MNDEAATQEKSRVPARLRLGLSARLLLLTISFVMLSEFLIYAPSIARFRKVYMEEHVATAHLATIALDESFGVTPTPEMQRALLDGIGAYGIILSHPERRVLVLSQDMPPMADVTFDLNEGNWMTWLSDAFLALIEPHNRVMRVMGKSPRDPAVMIEVVMDERPMVVAMYAYSVRILSLSIVISLLTAGLVYLALHRLLVRPMRGITESMMSFRADPEDERRTMVPSARTDEVGVAERELARMQSELRAALRQKTRLATLGAAVAKINHDLRNSLATAVLASDRLADIDDPEVKRVTPRLYTAIDRAVRLCSQTLNFVSATAPPLRLEDVGLHDLVTRAGIPLRGEDGGDSQAPAAADGLAVDNRVDAGVTVRADRDQMMRVFANLFDNAAKAGAHKTWITADAAGETIRVDVVDDGPGLPQKARNRLFQPFAGSARDGGTGLGLVIARDIVKAHGGDLELAATGDGGTTFRITLPKRRGDGER